MYPAPEYRNQLCSAIITITIMIIIIVIITIIIIIIIIITIIIGRQDIDSEPVTSTIIIIWALE